MDRVYLMVLAMLAFAVPAYFVTRVKLSMGEKGEPQTYYDAVAYMRASSEAAATHIHKQVLKMGLAWVLICAPLLSYFPGSGLDFKRYGVILLGCLLLGIILSATSYSKLKNFKSVEITMEDKLDYYQGFKYPIEKKMESARQEVKKINSSLLWLIVVEAFVLLLFQLPAAWASGFRIGWYIVFLVVFGVLILFIYLGTIFAN